MRRAAPSLLAVAALGVAAACGSSQTPSAKPGAEAQAMRGLAEDDRSRCDHEGRADREVSETAGPGAFQPNIRRVYAIMGEGEDRRRVLQCREVDTNLDGVKDVVRTYNDQGETLHEMADANYDGVIDTWVTFARGRIAKVEVDTNGDGRPDEARYYIRGKLSRVQRDTNFNGEPDVWEIYADGHLQRMGVDLDHDGHVDRWNRDEVLARQQAEEERRKEVEEERKRTEGERTEGKEAGEGAEAGDDAAGDAGSAD
jgi:DNA-binding transcriptional MerR regulator